MKAVWGVAYKVACGVCLVWLAVVLGVAVHYGWRALVADTFVIPSDSMSPTLLPGDRVRVDKTVFGARLYTSLDFTVGWRASAHGGVAACVTTTSWCSTIR